MTSKATRGADRAEVNVTPPNGGRSATGENEHPDPKPEPEAKPTASVEMAIVQRFRPTVTVTANGSEPKTSTCQHTNAHITKDAATTCARHLARELGGKLS